jgi:hypothetical protein
MSVKFYNFYRYNSIAIPETGLLVSAPASIRKGGTASKTLRRSRWKLEAETKRIV